MISSWRSHTTYHTSHRCTVSVEEAQGFILAVVARGYIEPIQHTTIIFTTLSNIINYQSLCLSNYDISCMMNMNNDGIASAAAASMNTNDVDNITDDMSKVAVSDNVICGTCTDTSSEQQKLEEHIKSDEIGGDASGSSSTGIDISGADTEICANCGKAGAKNICNKCKQVKYCNAVCKKKHKTKHKKCERRVAELRDIELFKQPPLLYGDCPICFLRLPYLRSGRRYHSCCGKVVCSGCVHAVNTKIIGSNNKGLCPFCRTPSPISLEKSNKQLQDRIDAGDMQSLISLGCDYSKGRYGLPQNHKKALELWHRAVELGCLKAYLNIGNAYWLGEGVERDEKKAMHYYELGAMGGDAGARHNLGVFSAGNMERALRHYMIAVEGGHHRSLNQIKELYSRGLATKENYTKALRSYQKYLVEIKSPQRDQAAAYSEQYKYIE